MTYLLSFIILANGTIAPVATTVHGSMQTCEWAKAKLIKEAPKDLKLVAICLDR